MKNRKVLISIIIPVYNVEQFVGKCLSSIFSQKVDKELYEVVIVNDGTKDGSMDIVRPYVEKNENAILIEQENLGLSCARNTGLAKAEGDYVWFVDSDDWLEDGAINNVIRYINEYDVDMITMPLMQRFKDSQKDRLDYLVDKDTISRNHKILCNYGFKGAIQRNIIKRRILIDNGIYFYPHIFHEDMLFGPQVSYLARKVLLLKNSYYNYRQSANSIMHNVSMKNAFDLIEVHKQLMKFKDRYVSGEDKGWFMVNAAILFQAAMHFIWGRCNKNDIKDFLRKNKEYRVGECMKCLGYTSGFEKKRIWLMACHPVIEYRIVQFYNLVRKARSH